MSHLKSLQRKDIPLAPYLHPERQFLICVVNLNLIYRCCAAGVVTRLVKVKAHAAEPLNEAAEALVSAAAE